MWWLGQLLSPLTYLRIRQGRDGFWRSKRLYDFGIPTFLGSITATISLLLPVQPALFGDGGIFSLATELLQLLVAFFIAALAAVATFQREEIDENLRGEGAFLREWHNGTLKFIDRELTRRQFICYLFGYLAFASLCLFLTVLFAKIIEPTWVQYAPALMTQIAKVAYSFFFWIVFWNILISTVLGIYFLSDRMQNSD